MSLLVHFMAHASDSEVDRIVADLEALVDRLREVDAARMCTALAEAGRTCIGRDRLDDALRLARLHARAAPKAPALCFLYGGAATAVVAAFLAAGRGRDAVQAWDDLLALPPVKVDIPSVLGE